MNRGVLESSPVQQMMANPNWWNINSMRPPAGPPFTGQPQVVSPFMPPPTPSQPNLFPQYLPSPTSSSSSSSPSLPNPNSWHEHHHHHHRSQHHSQDPPESWSLSQLLLGGLVMGEDEKEALAHNFQVKRLENWEEQVLNHHQNQVHHVGSHVDVKQEASPNSYNNIYNIHQGNSEHQDFQHASAMKATWSPHHPQLQVMPNSPTNKSCITTSLSSNSNMLDFSSNYHGSSCANKKIDGRHPPPDRSSESNSAETASVKKARVQPSSTQSTLKVRKEKLGGRIAALHQLVCPFGKTDTASVLSEAIGYIRFLQDQIEALSLPYLGAPSGRHQQSLQRERNCIFTEEPLQESCQELKKDLKSRGLCLVPTSCTLQMGSENGADYWASAFGAGFR